MRVMVPLSHYFRLDRKNVSSAIQVKMSAGAVLGTGCVVWAKQLDPLWLQPAHQQPTHL
jgi:hypothetical protein